MMDSEFEDIKKSPKVVSLSVVSMAPDAVTASGLSNRSNPKTLSTLKNIISINQDMQSS